MQNIAKNLEFILELDNEDMRIELENWLRYEKEKEQVNQEVEGARKFWEYKRTGR